MSLLLPESLIAREIDAAREAQADAQFGAAEFWTKELKRIDPNLSIVWVNENATEPDLEPARWHIRRKNPETVDTYYPLIGDHGEYREPGDWMLNELQAQDLWNPRVHRDRQETKEKLRAAKTRAKKRNTEQRQDEMAMAVRAAKRMKSETGFTKRTDLKGKPTENSR